MKIYNDGTGLSNIKIEKRAKKLDLPNFKLFMRDEVKNQVSDNIECGC